MRITINNVYTYNNFMNVDRQFIAKITDRKIRLKKRLL